MKRWIAASGLAILACSSQANVMNRLYVADMADFGKNVGFALDFENQAPDGQMCQVDALKAFLGVGDGKSTKYVSAGGPFHLGQLVRMSATIGATDATFTVDGTNVHTGTGFKPGPTMAKAASVPDWANGPSAYRLVEKSATITVGSLIHSFKLPNSNFSPALALFESTGPVVQPIPILEGETVRIEVTVQIEPLPDVAQFKPLIDKYGQVAPAQFPGKITSDSQLLAGFAADDKQIAAWKPRTDVDKFGGELKVSWAGKGTGFFRTEKRKGYWWLISPLGNPMFYTGVCTAPAIEWDSTPVSGRRDMFAELPPETGLVPPMWTHNVWGQSGTDYATIHGLNLLRRFGATNYFAKATDECSRRLAAWGFSGLGKWSTALPHTPVLPVIGCPDVPKIDRHFDVFDPEIRAKLKASVSAQIEKDLKNPFIIGYSYGNEYDEIVTPDEIQHILASKTASPAKEALIAYAATRLYAGSESGLRVAWSVAAGSSMTTESVTAPTGDVEKLRQFYEAKYYSTMYSTFKAVDPNHLYFGCWTVPGWWVSDVDWNLIAPNADVIGFDRYSDWPGIESLLTRFDKPVLLGEFSFPSWYGGARGFGRYSVYTDSDAESGQRYATLLSAAAKCPQCVGAMWFQYRDEPVSGRGPVSGISVAQGEHYAFGLVDACDLPKYDLVRHVRTANLAANGERLKAGG